MVALLGVTKQIAKENPFLCFYVRFHSDLKPTVFLA